MLDIDRCITQIILAYILYLFQKQTKLILRGKCFRSFQNVSYFVQNGVKLYLGFHQFSSYFPSQRFVYEFSKLGNLTPVEVIIEVE